MKINQPQVIAVLTVVVTGAALLALAGCGSSAAKSDQSKLKVTMVPSGKKDKSTTSSQNIAKHSPSKKHQSASDKAKTDSESKSATKSKHKQSSKSNSSASVKQSGFKTSKKAKSGAKTAVKATSSSTKATKSTSRGSRSVAVAKSSTPTRTTTVASAPAQKATAASASHYTAPAVKPATKASSTPVVTKPVTTTPVHAVERVGSGGLFKTFAEAYNAEDAALTKQTMSGNPQFEAAHVFSVAMSDNSMQWSWEPTTLGD